MTTLERAGLRVIAAAVADEADSIRRRFLEDAFTETLACQWRRRAESFEWARPKATDFNGQASEKELADRDARLASLARACRVHARLIETSRGRAIAAELAAMLAAEGVA